MSGPWQFDASVAARFDEHARQHIPGYEQVLDLSVDAVSAHCGRDQRVAEIGCATGYALRRLEAEGFRNLVGVDSSQDMLAQCRCQHAQLVHSDQVPEAWGPFQAVLLNWTLHFVPPALRLAYLTSLSRTLAPDGILLLTDKTQQSPFVEACYHDFKRRQGVSAADIAAKKASLQGVLETLPLSWYVSALTGCGLHAEVLWAQYGFVTFLARRRGHD